MNPKTLQNHPPLVFPLLIALFPALALYLRNIHEIPLQVLWRPLLLSLGSVMLLMGVIKWSTKDWGKAALQISLFTLLFTSYGQVHHALMDIPSLENMPASFFLLGLVYLGLWIGGIFLISRKQPGAAMLWALNAAAVVLVAIPLVQIIWYQLKPDFKTPYPDDWVPSVQAVGINPDVYYFVLDGYARSDFIQLRLNYDNTAFIEELEKRDFFVAGCSRANYNNTIIALTSTFNMQYFSSLEELARSQGLSRSQVWRYLKPNLTLAAFKSLGYQTIAFDTGYYWSTLEDVDIFLQPWSDAGDPSRMTPFEYLLLKNTPLAALYERQGGLISSALDDATFPYAYHVAQQEFILDQAPLIAENDQPTFAFIHIMIPHEPMVFSPEGIVTSPIYFGGGGNWPVNATAFTKAYINGIRYVNPRMLEIIDKIIANSDTPPIIIIQGDHGFWSGVNLPILNAYHLPGEAANLLYPTISPINTFRLIFDNYFGTDMGRKADISFIVGNINVPVDEKLSGCQISGTGQ